MFPPPGSGPRPGASFVQVLSASGETRQRKTPLCVMGSQAAAHGIDGLPKPRNRCGIPGGHGLKLAVWESGPQVASFLLDLCLPTGSAVP